MGLVGLVAQHGYAVTGLVLFLAALGVPLPMTITLLAGGVAAHLSNHLAHGGLSFGVLLAVAWGAALTGDTLLFFGGRYTGWWLLAGMCRVSMNPEQCIFGSAAYFYRRGALTLVFAKFVPGLGAMAAPLAGSLNMRFRKFFRLAALGNLVYCSAWLGVGWLFSGLIREIAAVVESAGHYLVLGFVLLAAGYGLAVLGFTMRAQRYRQIERISATGLYERLQEENPGRVVVIADVRSHGYYDPGMQRIKNSIRVEPHRLKEELAALREFMAPECEIYLYCSCIRDTTSVRVAHMLQQENCRTRVIQGGMKAWVKAGGAVELVPEADVQRLPRFE